VLTNGQHWWRVIYKYWPFTGDQIVEERLTDPFYVQGGEKYQSMTMYWGYLCPETHDYHYRQAVTAAGYGCGGS
jgi:hypothetical protein